MPKQMTGATPYFEVFDMVESLAFYRSLGFEILFASPEVETNEGRFSHFVRLKRDGVELMLNTAHDSNERPARRDDGLWAGHRHVALFIDCADVDALHAELTARGLDPAPPRIESYGMKSIRLRDPDGYGLNFHMPA